MTRCADCGQDIFDEECDQLQTQLVQMREALTEVQSRLRAAKQTNYLNHSWHDVLARIDAALVQERKPND